MFYQKRFFLNIADNAMNKSSQTVFKNKLRSVIMDLQSSSKVESKNNNKKERYINYNFLVDV